MESLARTYGGKIDWSHSADPDDIDIGFQPGLGGIDPATDPDERERVQAELDVAAFHAYGLEREQTKFVLDDFHQVQNPRWMTDKYFDLVL